MQDEKETYFTVFEHFPSPVILLNSNDEIEHLNEAAKEKCDSGILQNVNQHLTHIFPWLSDTIEALRDSRIQEGNFEKRLFPDEDHAFSLSPLLPRRL